MIKKLTNKRNKIKISIKKTFNFDYFIIIKIF